MTVDIGRPLVGDRDEEFSTHGKNNNNTNDKGDEETEDVEEGPGEYSNYISGIVHAPR